MIYSILPSVAYNEDYNYHFVPPEEVDAENILSPCIFHDEFFVRTTKFRTNLPKGFDRNYCWILLYSFYSNDALFSWMGAHVYK